MRNKIKIKVCGMREVDNISELAVMQPDYLGFIFYKKSKRFVLAKENQGQILSLPKGIQKVGVFVNASFEEIMEAVQSYDLQLVQLHGEETPELCKLLQQEGLKVIKVFSVGSSFDFSELLPYQEVCDYYLFDTKGDHYGGHGVTFNWSLLGGYDNQKPIFLSGGLDENNINEVLHLDLNIHAVDVNSKFEIEPGLKNIELLKKSVFKTFK